VKWFKNKIQVSQVLLDHLPSFSGSAAFSQQPHNQKSQKCTPNPSHPPATATPISQCKSVTKQRPSPPTAACPTRASVSPPAARPRRCEREAEVRRRRRPLPNHTAACHHMLNQAHRRSRTHVQGVCQAHTPWSTRSPRLHFARWLALPHGWRTATSRSSQVLRSTPAIRAGRRQEFAGWGKQEQFRSASYNSYTLLLFVDEHFARTVLGNVLQGPRPISRHPP
jgi:hypothetical protein